MSKKLKNKLVICPDCLGDGKETCHNPDHGFITAIGTVRLNGHANGCPCCGNDPEHKVKNGGKCETCNGTGEVSEEIARIFCNDMNYEYEEVMGI